MIKIIAGTAFTGLVFAAGWWVRNSGDGSEIKELKNQIAAEVAAGDSARARGDSLEALRKKDKTIAQDAKEQAQHASESAKIAKATTKAYQDSVQILNDSVARLTDAAGNVTEAPIPPVVIARIRADSVTIEETESAVRTWKRSSELFERSLLRTEETLDARQKELVHSNNQIKLNYKLGYAEGLRTGRIQGTVFGVAATAGTIYAGVKVVGAFR